MSHLSTLLPHFRPYRRAMASGILLVVVANLFTVTGPWILRIAIDALGSPAAPRGTLLGYAGLLVGTALLAGAARYGMRELLNGVSRRIECDLRARFFGHLLCLDASFFDAQRTGDIMSRATNDALAVRQAAGPAVMYAVNTVVISVFAVSLMIWISPPLTALVLIPLVVLPPVVLLFARVIHRRFERIQEQFANLSTQVQENLTGVRLVRAYVQEEDQARRFDAMNYEYMRRNLDLVKVEGLFHPIMALLMGVAMVVLLAVGGTQVMEGGLSLGDLVAIIFYVGLLAWPMIALGWVVNLFQRGEASMGRINEILETRPRIEPGSGLAPTTIRGVVEFRGVTFRYPGTERNVLEDVSFVVSAGETVAIVGPTGSGKSTLISLIPRLHDPTEGQILLDDVPLPEYDPEALRRRIGAVPQDAFLFSDTIASNVALGIVPLEDPEISEGDVDPRILRAAEVAKLHEQVEAFPRGYHTYLGERGINLSGGQKQRATLARALARDPAILILDDALSAVDTHTESR
ncbi:MAG: ABC transporter ATP-binding protein, partial [Gemmatimonadetes bacterium]|nr:ABC transporter ATP-binding protein [Gemmatimonadota bacterium]